MTVLVDAGEGYAELRGVEIRGRALSVGEVPRTGQPNASLVEPEQRFGAKYGRGVFTHDGRHAWLQVIPDKVVSWDFRKLGLT